MRLTLLLSLTSVAAPGLQEQTGTVPVYRERRALMSTVVTVAIAEPLEPAQRQEAFAAAFGAFAQVESEMNEWVADSPLGRINGGAGGPPVNAPPALCQVITRALQGAADTGGLFDPTWASLRRLWRFGPGEQKPPSEAEVKKHCSKVGWKKVKLIPGSDGSCRVGLPKGVALGLGGVAKGWGVDQAVRLLRQRGLKNFFVQAGGDLYLAGTRGDRPWQVGIRDPRGSADSSLAVLEVRDAAFSTSGDYEHFFIVDGVRYHHLIDPRTCRPATGSQSATVLAPTALEAEFLTKGTFILGGQQGLELAQALGASAVLVDSTGRIHLSDALKGRVKLSHARRGR